MAYSLMLNAKTWTLFELSSILVRLGQNASLEEKIITMEELTYTLSLCLRENTQQEMSVASMLTDATQILYEATAHLKKAGTMQQKMEKLWEGGWKDRAEYEIMHNRINGLKSSWQRAETTFLSELQLWILGRFVSTLEIWKNTPTGGTDQIMRSTVIPGEYHFQKKEFMNSMRGWMKTYMEI